MIKDDITAVAETQKTVPTPAYTYEESAIHPETGATYTYTVRVYAPEPNPNDGLNPAFAYGGK